MNNYKKKVVSCHCAIYQPQQDQEWQWRIQRGDPRVHRTPLWAAPSTKKCHTDVRLNGTPLSGYRTKKTAPMAHLRML